MILRGSLVIEKDKNSKKVKNSKKIKTRKRYKKLEINPSGNTINTSSID